MMELSTLGSGTGDTTALQLGRDLRALRKSRGLTLTDLARASGRSVGYLSQVERGQSAISVADLRVIARTLDVPISWFLAHADVPDEERGVVVRAGSRRRIGSEDSGLIEELLSPDLGGAFEMVRSVFEPGAQRDRDHTRPTEEEVYVISGILEVWIAGKYLRIHAGDSFRISGEPFRWRNPGPEKTEAIWVIAPPVY